MQKRSDIMVIIRSSNERTESWCYDILVRQVPEESVMIIREAPFSKAVEKTFAIGADRKKKWTLAVDADILLKPDAVHEMVKRAEMKPAHTFVYQGCVLDKLFNDFRPGGPHLYRTALLERAMTFIPDAAETLRPESYTYEKMAALGYHFYQEGIVYGIHDYEQYLKDIYRKSFIHARKHADRAGQFFMHWTKSRNEDYDVALKAFFDGLNYQGDVAADTNFYEKLSGEEINGVSLSKERKVTGKMEVAFVETVIDNYYREAGNVISLKKHTKTTYKRTGLIAKALWNVGSGAEAIGKRIKKISGSN